MTTRYLACLAIVALITLHGCATTTVVRSSRSHATGIGSGEKLAIVLGQWESCPAGVACRPVSPPASVESEISECIGTAISSVRPDLVTIPASVFRDNAYAGVDQAALPIDGNALLAFLREYPAARQGDHPRYVVMVRRWTTKNAAGTRFQGGELVWSINRHWTRESTVTAEIVDLGKHRIAGQVIAISSGESGLVVPVAGITPLLPIPYAPPTESEACEKLGLAVVDFLKN